MTGTFEPDRPPAGPGDFSLQGEISGVKLITDRSSRGKSNLVVDATRSFEIEVEWHVFGNLVPIWLTALSVRTKEWVVTVYAEAQGPGEEVVLGQVGVPLGGPLFSQDEAYRAVLTVPPSALPEEQIADPAHAGVYKIIVITVLSSDLGEIGYDLNGYAEGPVIKVESPL
ncbi:hypothetical protein [Symbioplanes lichenis]|uniref:hypothetical protein n=1 Tax=Symbioplanes lichenis TaxID=1629072 RepID=UPI0027397D26|nr:hypothetical protein [Actinoplanes lichenis]